MLVESLHLIRAMPWGFVLDGLSSITSPRDSAFTSEAEIGSRKHIIAPAAFVRPSQADALGNLWAKTTLKSPPSTEICVLPNCYTFKESLFEAKKRLLAP